VPFSGANPISNKVSYRDSRRAAARILQPGKRHAFRRFVSFVLVAGLALFVWNTLTGTFPPEQRAVLFLFLLAVGLWITEAVPAFAVGLLIMGYLVFALGTTLIHPEPWDVSPYLNTWSSPVIWLMLGGFFMAEGLSRTGLDRQLFALAIRPAGTRPNRVLLAVMLTSAVASMFISNTSTTVLMIGAVIPLVRQSGRDEPFAKALLVAIPLSAEKKSISSNGCCWGRRLPWDWLWLPGFSCKSATPRRWRNSVLAWTAWMILHCPANATA
jgi:sodium-dependent dicarboxylate transporter 2/3/5